MCFTWLERTFPGFAVYLFSGMIVYFVCLNMFLSLVIQATVYKNHNFQTSLTQVSLFDHPYSSVDRPFFMMEIQCVGQFIQ